MEEDDGKTPEQRLAVAKLAQHVRDLFKVAGCEAIDQERARRWFFEEGDLEFWCEMAGYNPVKVVLGMKKAYLAYRDGNQEIVKRMLLKWRAAPGEGKGYAKRRASRENRKANSMQRTA